MVSQAIIFVLKKLVWHRTSLSGAFHLQTYADCEITLDYLAKYIRCYITSMNEIYVLIEI